MSQVEMVYDILRSVGRPLHISEIMTLVAKRHGVTLDRESIVLKEEKDLLGVGQAS